MEKFKCQTGKDGMSYPQLKVIDVIIPDEILPSLPANSKKIIQDLKRNIRDIYSNPDISSDIKTNLIAVLVEESKNISQELFKKDAKKNRKRLDVINIIETNSRLNKTITSWNFNVKEELNSASLIDHNGELKIVALDDLTPEFIIYRGEPMTTIDTNDDNMDINEKILFWSVKIQKEKLGKHLKSHYPRDPNHDLDNIIVIGDKITKNFFGTGRYGYLYNLGSFFNHSCLPNALCFHYNNIMMVVAIDHIKKGDQICISYSNRILYDDRKRRLGYIHKRFGFACLCDACTNHSPVQSATYIYQIGIKFGKQPLVQCMWCGNQQGIKRCSGCGVAGYCSKQCQTTHWKDSHSKLCKSWNYVL